MGTLLLSRELERGPFLGGWGGVAHRAPPTGNRSQLPSQGIWRALRWATARWFPRRPLPVLMLGNFLDSDRQHSETSPSQHSATESPPRIMMARGAEGGPRRAREEPGRCAGLTRDAVGLILVC